MGMQARNWGINPGRLECGDSNTIVDVGGVSVAHATLNAGAVQSGCTVLLPHGGNLFRQKVPAACHVINGFGKSAGLVQVNELGTIETPIVLTNTLCVGTAYQALVEYSLRENPEIGRSTGTVNPVVFECNDGFLNDIRNCPLRGEHIHRAIDDARRRLPLSEGAVGAGRGMVCYQMKGGIGSASRRCEVDGMSYTLGALVLTNHGRLDDLRIDGYRAGEQLVSVPEIAEALKSDQTDQGERREQGSVIVLLACDAPLSHRQLMRIAKRAGSGLARGGSFVAGGSGEIVCAFSTGYTVDHFPSKARRSLDLLHDDYLDPIFLSAVEASEEAVLDALLSAQTLEGRDGHIRYGLSSYMELLGFTRKM